MNPYLMTSLTLLTIGPIRTCPCSTPATFSLELPHDPDSIVNKQKKSGSTCQKRKDGLNELLIDSFPHSSSD